MLACGSSEHMRSVNCKPRSLCETRRNHILTLRHLRQSVSQSVRCFRRRSGQRLKWTSRRNCIDDAAMRAPDQMMLDGADANVRTVYYLTVQNAVIGGIARTSLSTLHWPPTTLERFLVLIMGCHISNMYGLNDCRQHSVSCLHSYTCSVLYTV